MAMSKSKRTKKARLEKYDLIEKDLKDQLAKLNKYGQFYDDLVDHTVFLFKLKDTLEDDIIKNGLRIQVTTGNGFKKDTSNESVKSLITVSSQILRVLKELNVSLPDDFDDYEEDDYT